MKKTFYQLLLPLLLLASWGARAQTTIQQESFENPLGSSASQVDVATTTVLTTTATGDANQYYLRTSNATIATDAAGFSGTGIVTPGTGLDGSYYWVGEGVKGGSNNSDAASALRIGGRVTLKSVSIAGYASLKVKVAILLGRANRLSDRMEQDDTLRVQVRFNNAGNWVTVGQLVGDNTTSPSGYWRVDAGRDGLSSDDVAAGTQTVSNPLTDFTFDVQGSGSTMQTRVVVAEQGSGEEFAFDNIRVTGVLSTNQAPVLANIESTAASYSEGNPATQITSTLTVSDADNTTLTGGTVRFTAGFDNTEDRLLFTNQNGITGSYNTSTGILTLSGTATLAAYQAALRSIQYQDIDAVDATAGTRTVTFTVNDGLSSSLDVSRNITVTTNLDAASTLPYTEDLESNGEGTRYTSNDAVLGNGRAFVRTSVASEPGGQWHQNGFSAVTISGINNANYWWASGTSTLSGGVGTFITKQINAANYANLNFSVKLAASNNVWENTQYLRVSYRLNGGTWVPLISFRSTDQSSTSISTTGNLARDANPATTTGVPAGAQLTPTLTTYSATLPSAANGQLVDFKIDALSISGDGVGEVIAFDNLQLTGTQLVAPTVTTAAPTSITTTSAVLGGNATADGGAAITDRGVVYSSTNQTPTTSDTKAANGSGTGTFSATISGLTAGTTYYVRAYASNSVGTSYGSAVSFVTPPNAPVVLVPSNGSLVTTTTPTYGGTAQASSTVTVYVDGTNIGTVAANSAGNWAITQPTALTQGSHTVRATAAINGSGQSASSATNTFTVDSVRPTVAISSTAGTSGSTTSTTPLPYTVTFSEAVTGFVAGDVTIAGGTVSGFSGSGTTYTFNVTPSAAGTVTVNIPANVAQDQANNGNTAATQYSLTYQLANVTVVSVTRLNSSPTATTQVRYQVVFSGSVTGLTVSNFSLTTTGTISGASISSTSGSGTTYAVTVNTGTGDGTLRLDVANSTGTSPTISNVPYTAGEQYTITKSFTAAPTLRIQAAGSASGNSDVTAFVDVVQVLQSGTSNVVANGLQNNSFETNNVSPGGYKYQSDGVVASPWSFGPQAGVSRNNSDFSSTAASGDAVAFLQSATGSNGNVTQNLAVPTGSYQVSFQAIQRNYTSLDQRLNVFVNDVFVGTIQPNNIPTYDTFTSATFSVTAPALTATVSTTSASPTSTSPIPFSVSFSQSVGTTFTASDVTVTGGALTNGSFSGSGSGPYTFTVTPSASATVSVSLAASVATDANNTGNSASNTVSVQFQAPTITVAPATLPNGTVNVAYSQTLSASGGSGTYSYAITGGALPSGLSLSGSTISGTPTTSGSFNFSVTATDAAGFTGSRTYTLSINNQSVTAAPVVLTPANGFVSTRFPNYSGTAPANSTVTVIVDGASIGTTTANSSGNWSLAASSALADGSHTVRATAQASGQAVSASSSTNTFVVDTISPSVTISSSTAPSGSTSGTSPFAYTVTFSENVTGFVAGDVSVTNGTLSSFSGSGTTYTFNVTPSANGTVTVNVPVNVAQDAAGNGNNAASQYSITYQQLVTPAPVVTAPANGSLLNTTAPTYSGTAPAGSTVTVYVDGTSIGTTTATGGSFSLTQPTALAQGSHTVYATAQLSGGTVSANSNTNTFSIDSVRPTVALGSTATNPTSTSPIPVTVTFSENVTGFVAGDITVSNGTLSGFSGSGSLYTFSVTPAANGTVTVDIPANVAQDAAGNGNTAATQFSITYAQSVTAAPVVTTPANGSLVATTTPAYSGTAPAGSTVTVYVDGTSIGTTTTTGGSFSLTQPTALAQGSHTVYATAHLSGAAVSANSNTNTFTVDTVQPSVAISSSAGANGGTTATTPLPFTVTFSEAVTGFVAGDVSVTNGTITGFSGSGTTYTFTVTPTSASTATTVNVAANVAQDAAGNGNTAATQFSLTYQPTLTSWTGLVNTDWYTAGNWSAGVPAAGIDATIPTSPSGGRFPVITAGTANARNLTLNSGASLTQTDGTLVLNANLTNNGTFASTGGTVVLGVSTLSNILGSGNTRFWNLTVGASGAQSSTSASTSVQRLFVLNGNFATNGNPVTLESNATNTALVVNNGSNAIRGNVTVQRYITPDLNPGLGYRHVSAPISSATVASLSTGSFSPVVNPAYNTSATPTTERPFPTVYGYNQSRLATTTNNLPAFDKGWFSPAALSDGLTVGQGYTVNISAGQTWNFFGAANNGNVSQTLNRNAGATADDSGLQLVGNPYPSPLDWSQVTSSFRPNVDGVIYVWTSNTPGNPYAGNYTFYNNGFGNTSPVLPLGQAFFVRVTAGQTSGTLNLTNSHRPTTYTNPTYHRTTAETRPAVQLTLKGAGSVVTDDAFVYFEEGATDGFDKGFDAEKLVNPSGLNLSTVLSAKQRLSVDGRGLLGNAQQVVPLAVGVPAVGSYSLSAAQLLNLDATPVYLRDLQLGTVTDLHLTPNYQFTVTNASALITGRFELVFSPQKALATVPAALAQQVALYPNPAKKAAFVELPASLGRQAVTATLVDALGRQVRTVQLPAQGSVAHPLDLSELATGVYALRLSTSAGVVVKKLVVE